MAIFPSSSDDTSLDPVRCLGVWLTYHKAFGGE